MDVWGWIARTWTYGDGTHVHGRMGLGCTYMNVWGWAHIHGHTGMGRTYMETGGWGARGMTPKDGMHVHGHLQGWDSS